MDHFFTFTYFLQLSIFKAAKKHLFLWKHNLNKILITIPEYWFLLLQWKEFHNNNLKHTHTYFYISKYHITIHGHETILGLWRKKKELFFFFTSNWANTNIPIPPINVEKVGLMYIPNKCISFVRNFTMFLINCIRYMWFFYFTVGNQALFKILYAGEILKDT